MCLEGQNEPSYELSERNIQLLEDNMGTNLASYHYTVIFMS